MSKQPADVVEPSILGRRIVSRRKDLRLSQAELAARAKSTQPKISAWESGQMPDVGNLVKLADALECSVDYLLGRSAEPVAYRAGWAEARLAEIVRLASEPPQEPTPEELAAQRKLIPFKAEIPFRPDPRPGEVQGRDATEGQAAADTVGSKRSSKP